MLEAFCRGAGVDIQQLPTEGQERLLQLAGLLLRESLVGIKALARTQREIRQDSGLNAIAEDPERVALQNLPVEELLVRLLLGHEQRQLDAVQWMRELYGFACRHDAALMRALRPALIEFTQRLDPAVLGSRQPRSGKTGGEGGIRTHVPELPDHPISSRRRYDHFGTSPVEHSAGHCRGSRSRHAARAIGRGQCRHCRRAAHRR